MTKNELKEELVGRLDWFQRYTERGQVSDADDVVEQILTLFDTCLAEAVREARLDELKQLTNFRIPHLSLNIKGRNKRSFDDRITELSQSKESKDE